MRCLVVSNYVFIFAALALSVSSSSVIASISIGLESKIWPFMYENGVLFNDRSKLNNHQKKQWAVSERNLGIYNKIGARWNIVVVNQKIGKETDYLQIREIINHHKINGVEVVLRLIEDPDVYSNLSESEIPGFGYNKIYSQWVLGLAEKFSNDVQYYLISNEVDHNLGFNSPGRKKIFINFMQYKKLLHTAYSAIKSIDSNLMVVDHGVSSFTLGIAVADDIAQREGFSAAFNFWDKFKYGRISSIKGRVWLKKLLNKKSIRRKINIAKKSFSGVYVSDYFQFHHYFSSETLPVVIDWIRRQKLDGVKPRPIFAGEIGYRIPKKKGRAWDGREVDVADWDKYSAHEHATTLVKDFVYLFSLGIERALYWQARFHHSRNTTATLYKSTGVPSEFSIFPAGKAFSYLANTLNDTNRIGKVMGSINGLSEFYFTGNSNVSVVWAENDKVVLNLADFREIDKVYDMYGDQVILSDSNKIDVMASPLYLFWKKHKVIIDG